MNTSEARLGLQLNGDLFVKSQISYQNNGKIYPNTTQNRARLSRANCGRGVLLVPGLCLTDYGLPSRRSSIGRRYLRFCTTLVCCWSRGRRTISRHEPGYAVGCVAPTTLGQSMRLDHVRPTVMDHNRWPNPDTRPVFICVPYSYRNSYLPE